MGFKCRSWQHIIFIGALIALLQACGGAPSGSSGGSDVDTISFSSVSTNQIVIRGQGGVETSTVTFRAATTGGTAIRDENVAFTISSTIGGARLLSASGRTNSAGDVSTVVQSGTVAVPVRVTATLGSGTSAVSEEVQISTSTFIASSFQVAPDADDVESVFPGIDMIDSMIVGSFNLVENGSTTIGTEVGLQIIATDQFGHRVLNGSVATIVSPETGLVEPARCSFTGGVCQTTWRSSQGQPLDPYRLVSIMAYANGAEAFTDQDGDNIYDMGEPFTDLGEPFVDENGNNAYDVGEFFVDADSDGIYDATGNGQWDGPCLTEPNLCLGEDSTVISSTVTLRLLPGEAPTPTPTP